MRVDKFEIQPRTQVMYAGDLEVDSHIDSYNITIEVKCTKEEVDKLYKQFLVE